MTLWLSYNWSEKFFRDILLRSFATEASPSRVHSPARMRLFLHQPGQSHRGLRGQAGGGQRGAGAERAQQPGDVPGGGEQAWPVWGDLLLQL